MESRITSISATHSGSRCPKYRRCAGQWQSDAPNLDTGAFAPSQLDKAAATLHSVSFEEDGRETVAAICAFARR